MGSVPQRTKLSRERMIEICIELSLSLWLNDILHMERVKVYEAGEKQLPECGRVTPSGPHGLEFMHLCDSFSLSVGGACDFSAATYVAMSISKVTGCTCLQCMWLGYIRLSADFARVSFSLAACEEGGSHAISYENGQVPET